MSPGVSRLALSGRLSQWTLPGVLRDLRVGHRTGLLTLVTGEAKRALRWREGQIVAAHSNVDGERLPDWLLRLGLVPEAALEGALGEMRREAKGLAEVLRERGLLDDAGLGQAATQVAKLILERSVAANQGDYEFHDEPATEEDRGGIVTEQVILDAIGQVSDPGVMRYTVGDPDRVLRLARGTRFERLDLSVADGFFLSRVDGSLSGTEVVDLLPLEGGEAQRVLFRLICAGIVELAGAPKATRPLPEIATLAAERAARLIKPAPAPEEPLEEDVARESLSKAEREIAEGRPAEAARILETVVSLVEGELRTRVRRVLAEALLRDPVSMKRGEEQLHVLVAENPADADAFFELGKVYRARGLRQRADAMFRRVLDLDPGHEGARGALPAEETAPPRPATTPGFFGRLFGREKHG
jgi:hypothetical protein